ncbi:BQ2448_2999 [Microbotryum intermedium]|uniref:BQ2448_2999 protein n=1 Tax=Microbotryum intermedium TaxID=269621 RepID=A0A238FH00_9BASI|nr:BQ2448_2999 [Microbotryum intermedium]
MNDRHAIFYSFITQFDFVIRHMGGEWNKVPDTLSRRYEDGSVGGQYKESRLWNLDAEDDRDDHVPFERSLQTEQAGVRRSTPLNTAGATCGSSDGSGGSSPSLQARSAKTKTEEGEGQAEVTGARGQSKCFRLKS